MTPGSRQEGWVALREGRWADARDAFERAIADDAAPDAYEGLSWAAWWLDDADAVRNAREQAYRLYRQIGDPASAGRMAVWLAADEVDFRGALAVANGWLGRARTLLDPLPIGPDHGWLSFHEGYVALVCGEIDKAEERGARAAQLGQELRVPDLEMLGLALRGSTLVGRARVDEGMRCLDEATAMALAGEAAIPISGAWTFCFLVSACTAILDFQRAYEWCDRIAEFADRFGSRYMLAFCRAEYGAVHLWRGRWRDAEHVLEASVEDFAQSRPAMVGWPLVALAELRRRQARTDEATRLLDRAGPSSDAQVCRARLALDGGDADHAVAILERVLRQMPAHRELQRVPAVELLLRARLARGKDDRAGEALEELRGIQERVGTGPMRASVDRAAGMIVAAGRDYARARALLEDAVDGFEASGAPYESAVSRIELGTALLALGDVEAARRELEHARASLRDLGALADARRADELLATVSVPASVPGEARASAEAVTPRERQVLALLSEGLSNRQIGERLGVSEHTVHRHVTNILRKLDLPSRAAAAAHAVRSGLVEPGGA